MVSAALRLYTLLKFSILDTLMVMRPLEAGIEVCNDDRKPDESLLTDAPRYDLSFAYRSAWPVFGTVKSWPESATPGSSPKSTYT